jgi:hypothetical protein
LRANTRYVETIYDFLEFGPIDNVSVIYITGNQRVYRIIHICNEQDGGCTELSSITDNFSLVDAHIDAGTLSFPVWPEKLPVISEIAALGQHWSKDSPVALDAPWTNGDTYALSGAYYGEGAHNDTNNDYYATDWNKKGTECDGDSGQPVMAAATGRVILARNYDPGLNSGGKVVRIESSQDTSVSFAIYHLKTVSVVYNESISSLPKQIGTVGETGMNPDTSCAHIHLSVRQTINNVVYSIRPGNLSGQLVYDWVEIVSHNGSGGGGDPPSSNCPVYNEIGITLWDQDDCKGNGMRWSGETGVVNLTGITSGDGSHWNDRTESIYVHDGWSVRVWQDADAGLATACITGSKWDLDQDSYDNSSRSMHRDISSIQVFNNGSCTGGSAPSTPSNFRVSSASQTSITIAWNDVSNESGYKIYKWNGADWDYKTSVGANVTSYTDSSLSCGTTYFYDLGAYNDYGESSPPFLEAQTSACPVLPSTPSNPNPGDNNTLSRTHDTTLSWNTNGSSCQVFIQGGTINISPIGGCSSLYLGSQRGGAYSWYVKSSNSNGTTTGPTWHIKIKPYGPSNLGASVASPSQINLSWTLSSDDDGTNIDGYDIYRNGQLLASLNKSVSSYQSTGLDCNTNYSYYVKSKRQGVQSDASNTVNATTTGCVPSSELAIADISIIPATALTNDDVGVWFQVENTSTVDTGAFYVDVYVDDQPTGCADWGSYYIQVSSLAANSSAWYEVFIRAGDLSLGTHQIRVYADSGCEVAEGNENNNISGPDPITVTSAPAAPSHNDFDAAIDIGTIPYNHTVDVSGATRASDDPAVPSPCNLDPGMATVWYKYTAIANTNMVLDTFGSDYDTYLAVWSGSRGSLSLLACHDDYDYDAGNKQSSVLVNLTKGTTYYFEVAEWAWSDSASATSASSLETRPGIETFDSPSEKSSSDVDAQAGGTLKFNVSPPASFYTDEFGYGTGWIDPQTPRMLADVDGDGINDAVGFSDAGAVVALGTVTAFEPGQLWEGSFGTIGGWDGSKHIRTMADVNGDGKADLVGFGDYGVLVSLSTGSGFTPLSYWSYGYGSELAGGGWNTIDNNRYVADVNGDGKADIIGYGLYGVMVSLSNGSSFGTASYWTMGYGKLLGGWDGIQNPRMIADLNGDGCGDVVGFANYGVLVSLSNACGGSNTFGAPSYWAYGYGYLLGGWDATKHVRTFGDVNNDGTDDLVGFGDSGVLVSPSNGSSLTAAATYWKMGYGYVNGGWRVDRHPRMVADVNADGMADVVGFATNGVLISTSNGSSFP